MGESTAGSSGAIRGSETAAPEQRQDKSVDHEPADHSLQHRLDFQDLVLRITTTFIDVPLEEIDDEINRAIKAIGEFADVDRSYVFQLRDDGKTMDNTYEWCRVGVEPQRDNLQELPLDKGFPWFAKQIRQMKVVHIPSVAGLPPEANAEKGSLQQQDIQSLVIVPMAAGTDLTGFLGFDSVRDEKAWSDDSITLLKTVSTCFASALGRQRLEQSLRETRAFTSVLLDDSPVPTVVVNSDFSVRYVNRALEELTGYSSRELIGVTPPYPWWVAENRHANRHCVEKAFSMQSMVAEEVFQKKTGERFTVQIFAKQVPGEGPASCLLATFFDITHRKRAESLLRVQRDLGIVLSTTSNLDVALDEILKAATQIDSIDCGGVYLVDPGKGTVSLAAHRGLSPPFVSQVSTYHTSTDRGRLVLQGRPLYRHFDKYGFDPDGVLEHEGLRAVAVIPVEYEGKIVAALNLASHSHDDIPAPARDAVEAIATQVGAVIARVRVAAALGQSQHNLENLFNTLDDLAFVLDRTGNIIHFNRTAEQRLGYAVAELIGKPVLVLHPPDRRHEAGEIVAAMVEGNVSVCPVPLLAKDGTLIEVETKVTQGEWDGQPVLFGISRDISDRIRADKISQAENAFREAIIHSAAEGISVCRDASEFPHLRFDVWNHRMVEITGYTLEEINRLGWFETLHPEESRRQQVREYAELTHRGEAFLGQEWTIVRADGERRTLLLSATPVHTADGPLRMLAVVQDITERKQMEQALSQSEQWLTGIMNAITDHMTMMDDQYNIVWANDVARELFGSDLVGRKCHQVYHGTDEPCESCVVRLTFADGTPHEHETRVVSAAGERDFWCTSSVAARHEDGRPRLVIELSRDITDRKRAEERSRNHLAELAHVMRLTTMGEMASGMAHELNQPLTAIATYAGACSNTLKQAPSPVVDKATDILDRIERQAIRAGRIIHQLRSFVSRTPPARVARDMNELVREVLLLAETELRGNRISVRLDLDKSIPNVLVDAIQIQQVLLNFVKNAREALLEESDDRRELTIETKLAGPNTVEVAVRDSGSGVLPENADKVLDAFFTTKPDGMGMGLAISRSIIEAHGGRLWFTPNSDRGCTFRFTVPVLRDEPIRDVRRADGAPR